MGKTLVSLPSDWLIGSGVWKFQSNATASFLVLAGARGRSLEWTLSYFSRLVTRVLEKRVEAVKDFILTSLIVLSTFPLLIIDHRFPAFLFHLFVFQLPSFIKEAVMEKATKSMTLHRRPHLHLDVLPAKILVLTICKIRFITIWTTVWTSVWLNLLQVSDMNQPEATPLLHSSLSTQAILTKSHRIWQDSIHNLSCFSSQTGQAVRMSAISSHYRGLWCSISFVLYYSFSAHWKRLFQHTPNLSEGWIVIYVNETNTNRLYKGLKWECKLNVLNGKLMEDLYLNDFWMCILSDKKAQTVSGAKGRNTEQRLRAREFKYRCEKRSDDYVSEERKDGCLFDRVLWL